MKNETDQRLSDYAESNDLNLKDVITKIDALVAKKWKDAGMKYTKARISKEEVKALTIKHFLIEKNRPI